MTDQANGKDQPGELIVPVYVRFTPAQIERIERVLKRRYITSRSDFIRSATLREVDRILEEHPEAA